MFFSHPSDSNKDPGSSPNGVLFFFGPSLAKAEFSFTAGKEEEDRLIEIVVVIKDAYGESVENKLQIQVFVCFFFVSLMPLLQITYIANYSITFSIFPTQNLNIPFFLLTNTGPAIYEGLLVRSVKSTK